jgi:hypothetical protein
MITYKYYKFPNKESVPPKSEWPSNVNIDDIGLIGNNDGVYDELGQETKPQTYKSGWHVNICYEGEANLDFVKEYEIQVQSPRQIWFGQSI